MAPLQHFDACDASATAPALAFGCVIPAEPDVVYPEAHFENAVLALIRDNAPAARNFALIPGFGGLDVAIFTLDAERTNAVFLEIKSFSGQRQGGIGFGRSQGEGP